MLYIQMNHYEACEWLDANGQWTRICSPRSTMHSALTALCEQFARHAEKHSALFGRDVEKEMIEQQPPPRLTRAKSKAQADGLRPSTRSSSTPARPKALPQRSPATKKRRGCGGQQSLDPHCEDFRAASATIRTEPGGCSYFTACPCHTSGRGTAWCALRLYLFW